MECTLHFLIAKKMATTIDEHIDYLGCCKGTPLALELERVALPPSADLIQPTPEAQCYLPVRVSS